MQDKINIAIDGYSSTGKSTLAKSLAKKLAYTYIDSGAMYRAVTLYCIQNDIDYEDEPAVEAALANIQIEFKQIEGVNTTFLNGKEVEALIRSKAVSSIVSEISAIKGVRDFLVEQQKAIGVQRGVVMDGRDIGTVVFPDAELKIFMTADFTIRAQRRFEELQRRGIEMSLEEVKENLSHRDHIDTHRAESPLFKADKAILLDNTQLSEADQLRLCYNMAIQSIERHNTEEEE